MRCKNVEHRNESLVQAHLLIWSSYFEGRVLLAASIEVLISPHSISNPLYEFRAGELPECARVPSFIIPIKPDWILAGRANQNGMNRLLLHWESRSSWSRFSASWDWTDFFENCSWQQEVMLQRWKLKRFIVIDLFPQQVPRMELWHGLEILRSRPRNKIGLGYFPFASKLQCRSFVIVSAVVIVIVIVIVFHKPAKVEKLPLPAHKLGFFCCLGVLEYMR